MQNGRSFARFPYGPPAFRVVERSASLTKQRLSLIVEAKWFLPLHPRPPGARALAGDHSVPGGLTRQKTKTSPRNHPRKVLVLDVLFRLLPKYANPQGLSRIKTPTKTKKILPCFFFGLRSLRLGRVMRNSSRQAPSERCVTTPYSGFSFRCRNPKTSY